MDVASWVEAYRRAWEEKDAEAAAVLFDEQATYRSNIFEEPYVGREGVRRYWQDVTRTQEDVRVVMGRPFADGDRVAAEFWATMVNDGAEITLSGCLLLRFDESGPVYPCASTGTSSRVCRILRPVGVTCRQRPIRNLGRDSAAHRSDLHPRIHAHRRSFVVRSRTKSSEAVARYRRWRACDTTSSRLLRG